jgi:hypothetical protein
MNQIEKAQSPLTVTKHLEHKSVEYALKSLCYGAVYQGHDNKTVYKNIKSIIRDLIKKGYLPKDSYLGRLSFAGIPSMTRVAIKVSAEYLHNLSDRIVLYALDNNYDPDELLRVLNYCAINAASNGVLKFESITCQKVFRVLRGLPVSVRKGVLEGRYKTINLFNAV